MEIASEEKLQGVWKHYLDHPISIFLAAFDDKRLIGNLKFFDKWDSHPWIKHIAGFGMGIRHEYWGQGIGKAMINVMFDHAKSVGIKRIEAEVRTENKGGIALYTKCGFKIEGTREKCALINGRFEDEYYIAKLLT